MAKSLAEKVKEFVDKEVTPKAERLSEVRVLLNTREERFKQETDELYKEEAVLKAELVGKMTDAGLKSLKVSNGNIVTVSISKKVEVVDQLGALKWAMDNRLVSIDKTLVKQKLGGMIDRQEDLPSFVKLVEGQTITLTKPKPKKDANATDESK